MASNNDISRFAVFINSKAGVYPSSTKSDVIIPFSANLADHDPLKVMKISIVDVLFSNVFYNIRNGVNKLKFVNTYAAGRNKAASYTIQEVAASFGYYNYDSFTDWANDNMGDLVVSGVNAGAGFVSENFYLGFGSKYAGVVNNAITASSYSLSTAKVWFQSPSLGDYYQDFPKDNTVTMSGNHSYIYSGLYLIIDDITYGLLKLLGFTSKDIDVLIQPIPGLNGEVGIGFPIYSQQVGATTVYSFDGITFPTTGAADTTIRSLVPANISDFTGLDELYIHCEQLRTQFLSSQSRAPLQPNDVVCVVPINVAYGEKMSFIPNFPLESYLINTNITQLRFRMTNSNNEELDFKGINWSLTMFCEEVDDESRIQAQTMPVGNQPQTFFSNGQSLDNFMQSRVQGIANKRRLGIN